MVTKLISLTPETVDFELAIVFEGPDLCCIMFGPQHFETSNLESLGKFFNFFVRKKFAMILVIHQPDENLLFL